MSFTYPDFWKTSSAEVEAALGAVRRGTVHTMCVSAGGRAIKYAEYNAPAEENPYRRTANYSSACGANDPKRYADKTGFKPTVLFVGAQHGQELEGTAALVNLLSIIETGHDLRGKPEAELAALADTVHLIIMPIMNADGRARIEGIPGMIGMTNDELRHYGQGNWKDGTLCGWPGCKSVHPIKEASGFLGAYFNDDGVNTMHDNFFAPMAEETRALLALCDRTAPDFTVLLHGGSNSYNEFLQPDFVPAFVSRKIYETGKRIQDICDARGLHAHLRPVRDHNADAKTPPSLNFPCAVHHVCGGVCTTYESNEGLDAPRALGCEEILELHYVMFGEVMRDPSAQ